MADTETNPFSAHDDDDIPGFPDQTDRKEEEIEDSTGAADRERKATVIDTIHEEIAQQFDSQITSIVVCEPTECKDSKTGLIKWVEYKVITERADGSQSEVFRRYNHFRWLRKLLLDDADGSLVPPLPETKNFGRFDASFIERRRRRLEQFLNRVTRHPHLQEAKAFIVFLSIQDSGPESEMFAQALKGDSTSMSEKASNFYNSYRSAKAKYTKGVGEEEDDLKCAGIKRYGTQLEKIAGDMETAFLNLDNELRDVGMAWEKSMEFVGAIAEFEAEEGNERSAFCLNALKETCEKVGALEKEPEQHSTFTTIKLRDLFDDFSKYGLAIKECVMGRDSMYFRHQAEKATLANEETALEGLEGGGWAYNKEARISSTKEKIEATKIAVEETGDKLNLVTDRLQTEVSAFQRTKPERIEENLMRFADFQIEHMEQQMKYWQDLKSKLSDG